MYALISALTRRKGGLQARSPRRRFGWCALGAGLLASLGLAVVLAQSLNDQDHRLKLAGFLGTVYAEGPDKVDRRAEETPINSPSAGDQPVYALLHPGTSPAELAQDKTAPKPRPAQKPKLRKDPAPQTKGAKPAAAKPKKEQAAANKTKAKTAKKTKPPTPAEAPAKTSAAG